MNVVSAVKSFMMLRGSSVSTWVYRTESELPRRSTYRAGKSPQCGKTVQPSPEWWVKWPGLTTSCASPCASACGKVTVVITVIRVITAPTSQRRSQRCGLVALKCWRTARSALLTPPQWACN